MKRVIFWLFLIGIVGLVGYRGWVAYQRSQIEEVEVKEEIPPVQIQVVKTSPLTESLNLTGDVIGVEEIDVFPKVSGKLVEMKVREGSRVKRDEVLAIIDRDVEGVRFERAEVTSPVDGIVGIVYMDKGARVNPPDPSPSMGTALVRIVNMDTVKVAVNVIEKDLSKIKEGKQARIRVHTYPDNVFMGRITLVSPTVNPMTRTASVEITIPNPRHRLRPGMFAEAEIIIRKADDAILIPAYAVLEKSDTRKVLTVVDGKATPKLLELGVDQGDLVEVKGGLEVGDTLIVAGHHRISSGDPVRILEGGTQ
jgi:multidrug efflux pump subunit AcrA (membrane-fusion protein)